MLRAEWRLVAATASLAVLVVAVVGATAATVGITSETVVSRVDFAHPTGLGPADAQGTGRHLANLGLARVEASPPTEYCAEAVAAWHRAGDYRAPTGFLTTQLPHDDNRCNGVPVAITFLVHAQDVTISFWGADLPYQLTAYDVRGNAISTAEANGSPYSYEDTFTVSVHATGPHIARVVFGREKALTMIRSVTFTAPPLGDAGD